MMTQMGQRIDWIWDKGAPFDSGGGVLRFRRISDKYIIANA